MFCLDVFVFTIYKEKFKFYSDLLRIYMKKVFAFHYPAPNNKVYTIFRMRPNEK